MNTEPQLITTVEDEITPLLHDSATDTASADVRGRIRTLALLACPAGKLVVPATRGCSTSR